MLKYFFIKIIGFTNTGYSMLCEIYRVTGTDVLEINGVCLFL